MYKPMMSGQIVQNIERDVDGRNIGIINGGVMGRKRGQILEALSYICCMSCLIVSNIRSVVSFIQGIFILIII